VVKPTLLVDPRKSKKALDRKTQSTAFSNFPLKNNVFEAQSNQNKIELPLIRKKELKMAKVSL
jgi:hypothetical protein